MFVKMSLRDRLDCLVDFVGMILLCLLRLLFPIYFFQSFLSHSLYRRLERFSSTKNLSHLWRSKLEHVSTDAFCRRDDIFTQKRNCCSSNNLCKIPKAPSPLSSNRSIEWNLYLSFEATIL